MGFNPEWGMPDFPEQNNKEDFPRPGLSDVPASVREEPTQAVDPINSILPAYQPDQANHTETAGLNLAHLTEQEAAIKETAVNSERTANALEEIAKNQRASGEMQEETKLELEVIRRKIENL